uniref:Reverse transcriptase domain-containing protein n=1 Tax=Tanacetum cinerariifolium TaxID=118510 RepID=A0A6L2MDN6_TANCI|nr:reverse transcriptase domain-containing protein [Tanacetum cinerariifolium]
MEEDSKVPLILGRPILHTADAVIRVKQKQLNLGVKTERMIFNIDYAMKYSYSHDDTCFSIDVINEILEEDFDALRDEGSEILHSIKGTIFEEKLFDEFDEFMAMTIDENSELESDTKELPFKKITFNIDYKIKTSLEEPPTDLELKPLPDNLEYAFLEEPSFLPVIISSQISKQNKNKLVSIHKRHKLNPNMQDVVKKEIVQLLDTRIIYPIADTPWVSPIHRVPKKGGITVVTNQKDKLVPTRTVTGIVLGHKISEEGLEVDKAKIDIISKLPPLLISKTEKVAADHLSRIENDETNDDSEVDDNFPGDTLMKIDTRKEPWFTDFSKYLVCARKFSDARRFSSAMRFSSARQFNNLPLQDIYAAGSENRPPVLKKENYVPWSSRLLCYAKSRPIGKLIYNSFINGPYVRRMIPEPGDQNCKVLMNETFHEQTDDELTKKELKQVEANDQAIQTILLGLPEDIYAIVDSYETAYEIWLHPTTAMNMKLVLMAKAFKLNYSTPTNNNQRSLSNPRNRQIAQSSMNMGQDRQMQMVRDNGRNQFRQYAGQNVKIKIVTANQNPNRNDNVLAARAKGNTIRNNDGSAEVHHYVNCYNHDVFNMFTQEEQYTELLEPILEPHQVQQNDSNVIFKVSSVEQGRGTVDQHPVTVEETRAYFESLYNNLVIEVEKDTTKGASVNTQFCKQSMLGKPPSSSGSKLYVVTPFLKSKCLSKIDVTHTLSKPVTLNLIPTPQESNVVKNDKVIAPRIFRINPFKSYRVNNFVPNKHVKASVRTKPITVSQPHVITKEDVDSNTHDFSPKHIDSTSRIRRP